MGATPQEDIQKEPLLTQLKSLSRIYWIANWMELVERFAYYGVRVVLPVFLVAAIELGGPEFDHIQKGVIYAIWALVQSFVPILTGGYADRYGYKLMIAWSTVLKIIGYMIMGYCIVLAELVGGDSLTNLRAANTDWTYEIFFTGAMFLALGTAIFKPGVQGLVANQMPARAASFGWGVFYQMVNIGGFIGPLLAGYLRILDWEYVFLACSAGITLNFIPLFLFKEPEHRGEVDERGFFGVLYDAVKGLLEPRLFFFTIAFAGFWLMFYQLFDILPNFIDDWVDSRAPAAFLQSIFGEGVIPTVNQGNLTQEWMINFNALLISLFAFAMGYLTGKVQALRAIIIGIAVSAVAIYALGMSMNGWWLLGAILLFSMGEMSASPTKMRYLASIAPPGKEGLYMGYVNMTVGIGWSIGSIVAGELYQQGGDKVVLARRYLVEHAGVAADEVAAIAKNDLLPFFEQTVGVDAWGTRDLLWSTYEPYGMWLLFTVIGVASMVAIMIYNWVTSAAARNANHSFNRHGRGWVRTGVALLFVAFLVGCFLHGSLAVYVWTVLFGLLLVVSFIAPDEQRAPQRE